MNAANEVAVHAFLRGQLRFNEIAAVIEEALGQLPAGQVHSFDVLAEADARARRLARELIAARAAA
jgi:1-deoxy-D-xylulose-5-phosphate reductoisomerase